MKLAFFLPVAWAGDRCWSPDSPYTGTVSKQIGGVPCQSWDRDFPNTVGHYPKDALYSNYCRNPAEFSKWFFGESESRRASIWKPCKDNDPGGPWCYTNSFTVKEHQRYGYCDIPKCPKFRNKRRKQTPCSTDSAYYKGPRHLNQTFYTRFPRTDFLG